MIFQETPHEIIYLDDIGYDIGSYLEASKLITSEYICFLNTYSEIKAVNWLMYMVTAITQGDIGLAGATGSYESIKDTVILYRRIIWEFMGSDLGIKKIIIKYFEYLLTDPQKKWYFGNTSKLVQKDKFHWLQKISLILIKVIFIPKYLWSGSQLIWPSAQKFKYSLFPSFPNPHIRSNGFVIKRLSFLSLISENLTTKEDANLFESGPNSMTNIIKCRGLKAVIVGKNGQIYEEADWPISNTFRCNNQSNLLIGDNHTNAYSNMSGPSKESHQWVTWELKRNTRLCDIFNFLNKI